jgi:DHA2 family multidrug resistance protein
LPVLLALQFIAGLGSGTFVPLTISFVMRSLQPEYRVFGIAAYAMSLELSQNVPASIEGFYVDHWGWQWIFWQQVVLAPVQLLLIRFGMPRDPINWAMLAESDLPGILYLGGGASLAYAALDQGDRLDWLGSGVIAGLAAGALLLLALFILRELTTQKPFFDLRFASRGNLPKFAAILTLYRFQVLATAFVVPQFLIVVHGFRALEVGEALVWIAIPQFLLAPAVALLLRRVEARFVMAAGFSWIGLACLMVANGLTSDWISGDFLESQLLQAAGQTFGLTAFIFFAVQHLVPAQVLTFGAFLQTFRLLGGELGTSTMTWFVRSREQVHSNLLGQHVQPGGVLTESRLHDLAGAVAARSVGSPQAVERSSSLLAGAVRTQSYVLAFVDAMTLVAMATVCCLLFVAWLRPAPVVQKA